MGMYDHIAIESGVDFPEFPHDFEAVEFQTKSFQPCDFTVYKITEEGKLFEQQWHFEDVPQEERPYPDADDPLMEMAGSLRKVEDGWFQKLFHGVIRFYQSFEEDGERVFYEFEATFTDGSLEGIERTQ